MTQQHPITPPPELVAAWCREADDNEPMFPQVAAKAAQWGADQELEACCEWLDREGWSGESRQLRAARRPKLPMTELSPAAQATYDAFNRIGLYNEPSLKMTNQITLDEALKLVDFDQLQNGQWYVKTVKGNCITVQGYCEVIYGNVHTVEGRVVATINGREWQYVDDPRERVARLLKEGAPKEELLEALEQLDG